MNPPGAASNKDIGSLKAEWIGRVIPDPNDTAGALALSGYLGDSSKDKHHRLYSDLNLSTWVEIPAEDVLHAQRASADASLGEAIVWVRPNARLTHGVAGQSQAGSFLGGQLFHEQFAAAQAGGFPGAGMPGATLPPLTLPIMCGFPTLPPRCIPTQRCPTHPWQGCPPVTPFHGCPPPTPLHGCPPPTPLCPRTPVVHCLPHTVLDCPIKSAVIPCFTTADIKCHVVRTPVVPCLQITPIACPINSAGIACTGYCPSIVDACHSAPGGCDTPIDPQTPFINPAGHFGGGLGGGYGYGG